MSCAGDAPPARRDQEVERQYDALAAVPQGESSLGAPREQDQIAAALQRLGLPQAVDQLGGSTAVLQRGVALALDQVVARQDTEEEVCEGIEEYLHPGDWMRTVRGHCSNETAVCESDAVWNPSQ